MSVSYIHRTILIIALAGCLILSAGCTPLAPRLAPSATPMLLATPDLAVVTPTSSPEAVSAACSDPQAVIKAFYDANDANQFDVSLGYLLPDATLATWLEGLEGRHWQERHFAGREQIRPLLKNRGLRRLADQPDRPNLEETNFKLAGDRVTFFLYPDRLRPDGTQFNPFRVEMVFEGCKIKALAVIELFTQV